MSLNYAFCIFNENGKTVNKLVIRTGELTAYSNASIKMRGYLVIFASTKEVDEFLGLITPARIAASQSKPQTSDLFK